MNFMSILSIVFLIVVVIIGFARKINMGLLAIGFALILGKIAGMSDMDIISGFSYSMFLMLMGVTFLFGIAQENGTLEVITKKAIALVGKRTYLIPLILYVLSVVLAAIGPGNIPVGVLMAVFAINIAIQMDVNPIPFATLVMFGANAGSLSPIANSGIIAMNLGEQIGRPELVYPIWFSFVATSFLFCCILYFVFKCHKIRSDNPVKMSETPKFTKNHVITVLAILVMIVCVALLKFNVGLTAFLIGAILLIIKVGDEGKALAKVPWGTMILVCGVGVLMNAIAYCGGVDLISNGLRTVMGERTAAPIMAAISAVMSFFSSTTGVVMPALIPTLDSISVLFGGTVTLAELACAVVATSFATAGISPISVGGGIALSTYTTAVEGDKEKTHKMFRDLFIVSICGAVFGIILAALGFYKLF